MKYFLTLILLSFLHILGCSSPQTNGLLCGTGMVRMISANRDISDSLKIYIPYDTVFLSIENPYSFNAEYKKSSLLHDTLTAKFSIHIEGSILANEQVKRSIYWSHDTLFVDFKYSSDENYPTDDNHFSLIQNASVDMPVNKVINYIGSIYNDNSTNK